MAYLLLVSSIVAQAAIGSVPFITGVLMTLYDIALARRKKWQEEAEQARAKGEREGREQGLATGRAEGMATGRAEGLAAGLAEGMTAGLAAGREALLRGQLASVLADETLTAEEKNRFIAILNSATPD